jgi:hypothetical protein
LLQKVLLRCRFLLKLVQSRRFSTPLLFAESYPRQSTIELIQLEGVGLIGIQKAFALVTGCLELAVKDRPLRREHGDPPAFQPPKRQGGERPLGVPSLRDTETRQRDPIKRSV